MKEFIIFVCIDSTEIFFSKLRSSCSNFNLPSTVRGVSNKHCLLTFFIYQDSVFNMRKTAIHVKRPTVSLKIGCYVLLQYYINFDNFYSFSSVFLFIVIQSDILVAFL